MRYLLEQMPRSKPRKLSNYCRTQCSAPLYLAVGGRYWFKGAYFAVRVLRAGFAQQDDSNLLTVRYLLKMMSLRSSDDIPLNSFAVNDISTRVELLPLVQVCDAVNDPTTLSALRFCDFSILRFSLCLYRPFAVSLLDTH